MKFTNVMLAAAALSALARAQQLEVLYCEIPSSAKSVVPGALDMTTGLPEATNFRAIDDITVSPDGAHWMFRGRTQQGSDEEVILLSGSGSSATMFVQEGQPVPGGVAGEVVDFLGSAPGRFNTANHYAHALRARGGVASVFQKVILWNGTTSTIVTQMGDLYTGLLDLAPNVSGDETVGNSIGSIHLLDDGRIGSQDSTILNIHTSRRPAIFYDRAAFHQADVTSVADLAGSGSILIDGVSANSFYTSLDGAHWIATMDIDPTITSNNALVYDGRVVIENNQLIPGTTITCGSVFASDIGYDGTWYARGRDNSSTATTAPDWAVRSGVLIATTGDLIAGTETYGDTFAAFNGNRNGDWVLACNTSEPLATRNEVIVFNGQVVVREGDPVDVDGNGAFDDGAFIGRGNPALSAFQPNDLTLTDGRMLYFVASLNDGAGNDLGSVPSFGTPDALLRVDLGPQCGTGDNYCTAGTTGSGCNALISASGSASASAGSGFTLSVANVEGSQSGIIFYGVNGAKVDPWGSGTSFLCVKSPLERTGVQFSGGTFGACDGALSVDWNLYVATTPGAVGTPFLGGETVWAQGWFRDPPSPKTTSLSNAFQFVVCP